MWGGRYPVQHAANSSPGPQWGAQRWDDTCDLYDRLLRTAGFAFKRECDCENCLPARDSDFDIWQRNVITYASGHLSTLGLGAGDMDAPTKAQAAWSAAYIDSRAKQTAAQKAGKIKNERRDTFVEAIRTVVQRIQTSPAISDDERRALGITVSRKT